MTKSKDTRPSEDPKPSDVSDPKAEKTKLSSTMTAKISEMKSESDGDVPQPSTSTLNRIDMVLEKIQG